MTEPTQQTFSNHQTISTINIKISALRDSPPTQSKVNIPKMASKSFEFSGRTEKRAAKRPRRSDTFADPNADSSRSKNASRATKLKAKAKAKERAAERDLKRSSGNVQ